jgi:hypothetical protein
VPAQPGGQGLVEVLDALVQVQHLAGQLADDPCAQVLSGQPEGLLVGGGQRGMANADALRTPRSRSQAVSCSTPARRTALGSANR